MPATARRRGIHTRVAMLAARQAKQLHALILAVDGLQPLARDSQSHTAGRGVAWLLESGSVVSHLQMKIGIIVSRGDSNLASRHQPGTAARRDRDDDRLGARQRRLEARRRARAVEGVGVDAGGAERRDALV